MPATGTGCYEPAYRCGTGGGAQAFAVCVVVVRAVPRRPGLPLRAGAPTTPVDDRYDDSGASAVSDDDVLRELVDLVGSGGWRPLPGPSTALVYLRPRPIDRVLNHNGSRSSRVGGS